MIALFLLMLWLLGLLDTCPICEGKGYIVERLDMCSTKKARPVCWCCNGNGHRYHRQVKP